ncbi:phage head closure protein [Achromobacter xylosoxidans]
MLRAGKLNTLISIRRQEQVKTGGGQVIGHWIEHAATWANVRFPSGSATIKAGSDVSLVRASMRIRFRDDIRSDMRVVTSGMVFDIQSVLPDLSGREYVDLVCQSIPGARP